MSQNRKSSWSYVKMHQRQLSGVNGTDKTAVRESITTMLAGKYGGREKVPSAEVDRIMAATTMLCYPDMT